MALVEAYARGVDTDAALKSALGITMDDLQRGFDVYVAKEFFGFREDERMRAHVADGRRFVETLKDRYDALWQRVTDELIAAGLMRGDARLARGKHFRVEKDRKIDVARIVELARPELAHAEDDQAGDLFRLRCIGGG